LYRCRDDGSTRGPHPCLFPSIDTTRRVAEGWRTPGSAAEWARRFRGELPWVGCRGFWNPAV